MARNKSIGIFDSGFGGLSVMRGIIKKLPKYDFVYLGDTARVPYGTRSRNTIYKFTKQAVNFLVHKNCQLIILACNTVSSDALWKIQHKYIPQNHRNEKVLGVLVPAIEVAAEKTETGKIGVMATSATVKSKAFLKKIKEINQKIKIFQIACPNLVPLIETGKCHSLEMDRALKKYLKFLIDKKIDTLILGCTHYGIIEEKIKKIVGKKVKIISQSKITAGKLKNYLKKHPEIENTLGKNKKRTFYSTDPKNNFKILGSQFLGEEIEVEKINLK